VARAPAVIPASEPVEHGAVAGAPVLEAVSDARTEVTKAAHAAAAANLAAEQADPLAAAEADVPLLNRLEAEVANALRAEEAAAQATPRAAPAVVIEPGAAAAPRAEVEPVAAVESLSAMAPAAAQAAGDVTASRPSESHARLQVLNGTAAGRILEISKPLTTIGRPDDQVAVISRRSDGYYLAQVDGERPARLNGVTLAPHAVALQPHDILEIAGVKLEFFFQS
jgi:hypothetical protein